MTSTELRKRPSSNDPEQEARGHVAEIKSFYTHLAIFLMVHVMLVGIYLLSGGGHFWPLYSFFGWGIGVASHGASTFGLTSMYGRDWEERKVREIMLQKEHGLSADEVRGLLKQEMATKQSELPSADEWRRMRERLENLEAIVTSRDWDELPSHSGPLRDEPEEEGAHRSHPTSDAARLAKRVR